MSDNITLPRELVERARKALTPMAYDTWPRERNEVVEALRTALAAEPTKPKPVAWVDCNWQWDDKEWTPLYAAPPAAAPEPTHPGYVIGSHWLETAYSRVCAGEAEADVLRDCGWERVDDVEALRRDAERLQDVVDSIYVYANDTLSGPAIGPDDRKFHREGIVEIRNRARQLSNIGSAAAARAAIEARRRDAEALDRGTAAMNAAMEDKT